MLESIKKSAGIGGNKGRMLVSVLLIALLALLATLARGPLKTGRTTAAGQKVERRALPDDVEGVLTSFSYSEAGDGSRIRISGKKVVRRGRRILGLRSNLVKTNFIEQITGTVRTAKGTTTFAAAQAEWDAEAARPLVLKKGVSLTVCGESLPQAEYARIDLKKGVVEVGEAGRTYLMK